MPGGIRKFLIALAAFALCSCQTAQAAGFRFGNTGFGFSAKKAKTIIGAVTGGINAPILARTSTAGSSPFTWDETLDATVFAGYNRELQTSTDNTFASVTLQDLTKQVTESEMAGNPADWSLAATNLPPPYDTSTGLATQFTSWSGLAYMRERIRRDDGIDSPWSNVISDTISSNQSRYWRLRVSLNNSNGDGGFTAIAEIKYRTTIGSSGSAVAPTSVTASSYYTSSPTYQPSNATDGNNSTDWNADTGAVATFDATFSSPIEDQETVITASASAAGYSPDNFKMQRCDVTFTTCVDYLTVTGSTAWSANEVRTFHN